MKYSVITCHNLENCYGWKIIVALPVLDFIYKTWDLHVLKIEKNY